MLISCLLTAYLIILPAQGKPHYEDPSIKCEIKNTATMFIREADHVLVIEQKFMRYEIPLIRHDGTYTIRYWLGDEYAYLVLVPNPKDSARIGEALVDSQELKVMARFGPKEGM